MLFRLCTLHTLLTFIQLRAILHTIFTRFHIMARTKKKRYQLLRNVVLGTLVFIMLGMILGGIAQATIVFMLTGIISGTTIVVPVWGMLAIYLTIVAGVSLTYYIDRELEYRYVQKIKTSGKSTAPQF